MSETPRTYAFEKVIDDPGKRGPFTTSLAVLSTYKEYVQNPNAETLPNGTFQLCIDDLKLHLPESDPMSPQAKQLYSELCALYSLAIQMAAERGVYTNIIRQKFQEHGAQLSRMRNRRTD